jgi:hypothetical protein
MQYRWNHLVRTFSSAIIIVTMIVLMPRAAAAEVEIEVSPREVFVGAPFVLRVIMTDLRNTNDYEPPDLSALTEVRVLGDPGISRNSSTNFIGGRTTTSHDVILSYQLVAEAPGEIAIPPLAIVAGGQRFTSRPMTVVATESEPGDLLHVDIVADRGIYYVGETVNISLEIWLRPFRPERSNDLFSLQSMWGHVRTRSSDWGLFGQALGDARARQDTRPDENGVERAFYVYFVPLLLVPDEAGTLIFDDVRIVVDYPTGARQVRGFMGATEWRPTGTQTLVVSPESLSIEVRELPTEGRPRDFTGSIGRFTLNVSARPTDVAVGDPITLTMTVFDMTPRGARMDLLQPPRLDLVDELTADFRVPADPLAGVVNDRMKTFTQTIRAKDDSVKAIPSIPFSFFDPEKHEYVTVMTDPIPISVAASTALTMEDVIGGETPRETQATELTEIQGGILANHLGPDVLAASEPFALRGPHLALAIAPPLMFAFIAVGQWRTRRLRDDRGYARRRSAKRIALKRLAAAGRSEGGAHAEAVATALSDYVADRCNLPAGALTRAEVIERLRSSGIADDLIVDVGSLLEKCESLRYGGGETAETDSITERAASCIRKLERERIG